ncbi:LysE family transporter [Saccharibacillus kuerlensis]|uniref:Amino acid transporter LysE n=1 Tax=Saccharibacillus kuerlensis TaxID=459527 RepID=A0ABQ2KVL1_9BACL|nr:LysE family transporter [Saccharibacillus kuerlensis]GGN94586.1 amino acid transporter LysE [Saccharibacillus kuerlensis]
MPFVPLLFYALAASFTPGPNNLMALDGARRIGLRKIFPFVLGISGGCLGVMLLACVFNLVLYRWIPGIRLIMSVLGSGYMLWLAIKIWRSTGAEEQEELHKVYSFRTGFWLQFINPKLLLYAITVISAFAIPYSTSPFQLVVVSLMLSLIGLASSGSWAAFGALFQPFLSRHERAFNGIMALLLLYSAVAVWF